MNCPKRGTVPESGTEYSKAHEMAASERAERKSDYEMSGESGEFRIAIAPSASRELELWKCIASAVIPGLRWI